MVVPAASIAGLLVVSASVAFYFLPQWTVVNLYKSECKAGTSRCDRAVLLTDSSKTTIVGDAYQHFGLDIQFPWRIAETRNGKTVASITFDNGNAALVFDSNPRLNTDASLRNAIAGKGMEPLFGVQAMRSDYDLLLAAAELAPKTFPLWMPRREAIRDIMLGGLRVEIAPIDQHGFFLIQQGDIHGFQAGTPGQDRCIRLLLFDGADRRAELAVYSHSDLRQADVNVIVASIRMVPP